MRLQTIYNLLLVPKPFPWQFASFFSVTDNGSFHYHFHYHRSKNPLNGKEIIIVLIRKVVLVI